MIQGEYGCAVEEDSEVAKRYPLGALVEVLDHDEDMLIIGYSASGQARGITGLWVETWKGNSDLEIVKFKDVLKVKG